MIWMTALVSPVFSSSMTAISWLSFSETTACKINAWASFSDFIDHPDIINFPVPIQVKVIDMVSFCIDRFFKILDELLHFETSAGRPAG